MSAEHAVIAAALAITFAVSAIIAAYLAIGLIMAREAGK